MATKQSTVDYILDQLVSVGDVSAKKMFGEYALYSMGKVVALVCDDILYVKITKEGVAFAGDNYREGHAYEGAKVSMIVEDNQIEDREWLSELVRITTLHVVSTKQKSKNKA